MFILAQVILILLIFLPVRYLCWKITEVWGLPEWLDYKPWVCKLCLTFWCLLATYITIGFAFSLPVTGIGGVVLAILNALAMHMDQKNKTIKI